MLSDRLHQVEKNLTRLRKQLWNKEDTLITIAPEEKERIRQQIEDFKAEIQPLEEEYWQILAELARQYPVSDQEAEVIVAEFEESEGKIRSTEDHSQEILAMLRQILTEVSQEESTAAAKLKGIISSFPPFIGLAYEAELDTEKFLLKYFPTFRKWSKALVKK